MTTWHPLSTEVGNHFVDKRRSLGRYSSLADSDHGVFFISSMIYWILSLKFPRDIQHGMLKQVSNFHSVSSTECCINKFHFVTPYPAWIAEWRCWRHAGSPQPGYWLGQDNADAESLALKELYLSVGLPTPPTARPFLHPLSPAVLPYAGVNKLWHLTQYARNFCLQKKKKLQYLSPRANYTDWATAACRRSDW
jgi:hypothetical protein